MLMFVEDASEPVLSAVSSWSSRFGSMDVTLMVICEISVYCICKVQVSKRVRLLCSER
jgi:hypothetical protein